MVPSLLFGFLGQYPGEGLPAIVERVSVAPHQEHLYSIVLIVSAMFFSFHTSNRLDKGIDFQKDSASLVILFCVFLLQLLALGIQLLKSVNSFLFGVFEVLTH